MTSPPFYPTIEIDLKALQNNYRLLAGKLASGNCAAVVKANAYGLGVKDVARALWQAGCREFFVATLDEAIELRGVLAQATLYVFHGARAGQGKDFTAHNIIPVLNSPAQVEAWGDHGAYALHVDTGMCRLGYSAEELEAFAPKHAPVLVLSHLACAEEPEHPKNAQQQAAFTHALASFKGVRASLANSSGIFLGAEYHFDLARPGCSLYGIAPSHARPNPVQNVATLSAPVLQYRALARDETVGYGATYTASKGSVLATVELGYADGFLRALSNKAIGYAGATQVKLAGRVSMDMVSVDVSAVPAHLRTPELRITFIGDALPVDDVAAAAGTIGYEIFTGLGARIKRVYRG